MKLRNKKTGEIADVEIQSNCMLVTHQDGRIEQYYFDSIKDLLEWEDYEEPKHDYYFIRDGGNIDYHWYLKLGEITERRKEIGNYFESEEEAEKTVEKLKAYKRLKDKGFRFEGWEDLQAEMDFDDLMRLNRDVIDTDNVIGFRMDDYHNCIKDLDLLFEKEEE